MREGMTTVERDRVKTLERENRELRQANEILRKASAYFAPTLIGCHANDCRAAGRNSTAHSSDDRLHSLPGRRFAWQICREGTYYHRLACLADPSKASARHQRDTELRPEIKRVWDDNYQVYGVRKAKHRLKREGFELARCTVERLMKQIGIRGAARGKVAKTTIPDTSVPCPRDKVNRVFRAPAPNLLWVSDFTYVSTTARQWAVNICQFATPSVWLRLASNRRGFLRQRPR